MEKQSGFGKGGFGRISPEVLPSREIRLQIFVEIWSSFFIINNDAIASSNPNTIDSEFSTTNGFVQGFFQESDLFRLILEIVESELG
jgi:hypothetical protein